MFSFMCECVFLLKLLIWHLHSSDTMCRASNVNETANRVVHASPTFGCCYCRWAARAQPETEIHDTTLDSLDVANLPARCPAIPRGSSQAPGELLIIFLFCISRSVITSPLHFFFCCNMVCTFSSAHRCLFHWWANYFFSFYITFI
jgi:hypothetical protein